MSLIKKNHSFNVFPVKMIRNFFLLGGGGEGGEEGGEGGEEGGEGGEEGEGEARMAQGRERSLFPTSSL